MSQLLSRSTSTASVLGGKQNERVLTYLQDTGRTAGAGLVLRGDEAQRLVRQRVRHRLLHRQRHGLDTRAYKDTLLVHTASLQSAGRGAGRRSTCASSTLARKLKGSTDGNGNALLNYTLDAGHVLIASSGGY